MASGVKNKKYTRDDKVDEYLLNQVAKHVNLDEISFMARDLKVEEYLYSGVPRDKDKAFKVRFVIEFCPQQHDSWQEENILVFLF